MNLAELDVVAHARPRHRSDGTDQSMRMNMQDTCAACDTPLDDSRRVVTIGGKPGRGVLR